MDADRFIPRGKEDPQYKSYLQRIRDTTKARNKRLETISSCESCGWKPPSSIRTGKGIVPCLEIHHIKAVCDGGGHEEENTVILCPNCHSIADMLGRKTKNNIATVMRVTHCRLSLLKAIQDICEDDSAYVSAKAIQEARKLHASRIQRTVNK